MRFIFSILVIVITSVSGSYASNVKQCTKEDAYEALSSADHLKSWEEIYRSYKRYSHCNLDNGAISEGYSDSISRLFANDWGNVTKLNKLCNSDKTFQDFIYRHLDMTIPADTWTTMVNNATKKCPSNSEGICKLILKANDAIELQLKRAR